MLKITIIEDEEKSLGFIRGIIEQYCPTAEIAGTATNVESAVTLLTNVKPALVLSDINLPDGTAFDMLSRLDEIDFKVIFITAFEEYAIKAIKFSALDYLVKPIDPNELINAVNKAREQIEHETNNLKLKALLSNVRDFSDKLRKIVLKTFDSIYVVDLQDIIRCESDNSYTLFYLKDNRKIMVSSVLKDYDELLADSGFIRVHKSHLVNLNYIDKFIKSDGGYLIMKDGASVPVSQRKRDMIMDFFNNLQ
ncbi:MAG: response regulator transcription factor [Bacteroidales bacterium]|nr:response regulator transcription factor [Bacteroidales bacterium]